MKRGFLIGLSLLPVALSSCGKSGYVGLYSFQMGKNSGAHVITSLTLGNEDFLNGNKSLGKKLTMYGQVATGPAEESSVTTSLLEESTSQEGDISLPDLSQIDFSEGIMELLSKGVTIPGYYRVGDDREGGRKHLLIGFSLDFIEEVADMGLTLDPSIIEKFVYCEIESKKIYLQIPVSFEDLEFQLYWYGIDLNLAEIAAELIEMYKEDHASEEESATSEESASASEEEVTSLDPIPVEPHQPGTKPTKEDIEEINKTYPASHHGKLYRNFYTVSLALSRQ